MDGDGRRQHHADGRRRPEGGEETEHEECAAAGLGHARQHGVAAPGPEPQRLEELARPVEPGALEPPEQLLGSVRRQHQPHNDPDHEDPEVHDTSLVLSFSVPRSGLAVPFPPLADMACPIRPGAGRLDDSSSD